MTLRPTTSLFAAATLLAAGGWAVAQTAPVPEVFTAPSVTEAPVVVPAEAISTSTQSAAVTPATTSAHPAWVDAPLEPLVKGEINRVVYGHVDVVVIDGGLYQGLRVGTQCVVLRQNSAIAELVIVASEAEKSAAAITLLGREQGKEITLLPGDQVRADFHPVQ